MAEPLSHSVCIHVITTSCFIGLCSFNNFGLPWQLCVVTNSLLFNKKNVLRHDRAKNNNMCNLSVWGVKVWASRPPLVTPCKTCYPLNEMRAMMCMFVKKVTSFTSSFLFFSISSFSLYSICFFSSSPSSRRRVNAPPPSPTSESKKFPGFLP